MRDPHQETDNAAKPKSLEDLDARLKKARRAGRSTARRPESEAAGHRAALGVAWRISIEMAVAIGVCGAIGYGLDRWLGTVPWLMLGFLVLGFAAGVRNVYRVAQEIAAAADGEAKEDGDKTAGQ